MLVLGPMVAFLPTRRAGISGFGGLYYTMDYIKGTWSTDGSIEKLGWLAVALAIFVLWRFGRGLKKLFWAMFGIAMAFWWSGGALWLFSR